MYKKGDILFGQIKKIADTGLSVKIGHNVTFFIPLANISDSKKIHVLSDFKLNEKINFVAQAFYPEKNFGLGNFKLNHPRYCNSPFTDRLNHTKHGFETLFNSIEKDLKSE
ncbi:S1 RNA-binding domain-containing protein [Mycoplasmopsis gallinarum]|uniref:S1 RNA-binding domain-containing protein n=1 Tax=Mycoplasmopsis gallinarum TaxID=29557 RepID=UPI00047F03D3|nr:S1 RNA-binding domain-containing protein [Mycoplasmopsis gallinarum]